MWTISKALSGEIKVSGGGGSIHTFQRKELSTIDDKIRFINALGKEVLISYKEIVSINGQSPAATIGAVLDQILALFEGTDSNPMPFKFVTPGTPFGMSVTTSTTGNLPVTFADQPCKQIEIINDLSVGIEYQVNATGAFIHIPASSWRTIDGITNASQIGLRRTDLSNTSVTVTAEARI